MKHHHVLLVEDDPDHAYLETEALEAAPDTRVDVDVVRGGREALAYLFRESGFEDAHTPSLILLDIKMPEVDGFEVLRRIKEDERLRVIPVVMLTSSDAEEDVARSYDLGSNSFVTKPVDAGGLHDRLVRIPGYWFGVNTCPPEDGEEPA